MRRRASLINGLLGLDKPTGMTSHDAVAAVRRALGERRVGHAGTLDPSATGVLVVGVGQATRLLGLLAADRKSYEACVEFGFETDTDDAQGTPTVSADVPCALRDAARARALLASLTGRSLQVPPAYSAISVRGRRAYDIARSGGAVELEPRPVVVYEATLVSIEPGDPLRWRCRFEVSKGTYVRALARDLGRMAKTAAHLCELRRTASGGVSLSDCVTLERLAKDGPAALESRLLDPCKLLDARPWHVDARVAALAAQGRALDAPAGLGEGRRVGLVLDGGLVGVWHRDGTRLRCDLNFPQPLAGVRP
ncbi:tRNA pseudouridine(55) synthase TruB [Olsenella sp. HMSC062G07]|uniref:tRNA pseudouridine(55) synthase TruB n=1 Tax=Olsenella sp. HMSC062G07 TaxID=1739330 RepID=UPI0008A39FA8|nr:tRNA pseudouridine(55) synthase TruB [Olsenella sp. HMSC062G07]OFK24618.1 tRNA pseudouridine(55) synthase [Olsenella sp. HMSC062G07]